MDFGFGDYLQFVFALIFVLALIALFAVVARRMGFGYRLPVRGRRTRRLAIIEAMPLDARRRLVLVRRDAVEYLLLLGANNDLVVEGGMPAPGDDFPAALKGAMASVGKPDAPR